MFTKQHFIQIAEMLKNERLAGQYLSYDNLFASMQVRLTINNIENRLIDTFIQSNPRFDVDKFKQASNLSQAEKELAI